MMTRSSPPHFQSLIGLFLVLLQLYGHRALAAIDSLEEKFLAVPCADSARKL